MMDLKDSVKCDTGFCHFQDKTVEEFVAAARHLDLYEGREVVFYEGKPCTGVYVLCTGKVKLTQTSSRGRQQIVKIVQPGELIEQNTVVGVPTHTVTCETLEPSQICFLKQADFDEVVRRDPTITTKLITALSREVEWLRDQLGRHAFATSRERLAETLVELAEHQGRPVPDGLVLDIRLTREELAAIVGVALETVVRLLGQLKQEKLVRLDGKQIVLLNPERLRRISGRPVP